MKQIQSSFFVLFYLKKERALKTGEMPICMRVTINKQRLETRIKRSVKPELWNQAKECCKGKDRSATELNYYIEGLRAQVFQIQMDLQLEGKPLTIDVFKKKFFHLDGSEKTLLTAFNEHVEQCTLLIGKDFTFKTVQRYATTAKYLGEFLKKEYNRLDILLSEIDKQFIVKFDIFLKTQKGCAQNAAITRLKNLKKIIKNGLENEWIRKDPFAGFKFKIEETYPEFLTKEELEAIISKEITIQRIEQVRDIFCFCSFTGLAFSDVQQLRKEHIVRGNNGEMWIRKSRQKTKNMCNIPLLELPQEILEKYSDHPECQRKGTLLPVLSNQRMNSYLKEISDICGIKKNLTTHVARHTFATVVTLANNVSIENVSKMLGHSDISMTKHYARVLD